MTTPATGATVRDLNAEWVPADACTLPTAERPLRVAEFDDVFVTSLREVQRAADGRPLARLVLSGDDGLALRVQRLADRETACCSFFTFSVVRLNTEEAGQTTVALDVEVPAAQAEVLDALLRRAATGLAAR